MGLGQTLLFLLQRSALLLQGVVVGLHGFQPSDLAGELLLFGYGGLGLLRRRRQLGQNGSAPLLLPGFFRQGLLRPPAGLGLGQPGHHLLHLPVGPAALAGQLLLPGRVPGQQLLQQTAHLRRGQLPAPGPLCFRRQGVLWIPDNALHKLTDACGRLIPPELHLGGALFQLLLQGHIQPRPEDVPEDLLPLLGVRLEQLAEAALGDHGHLGKLLPGHADDLPDGPIHLFPFCHHPPVRVGELGVRRLAGGPCAPGLFPLVLRAAADGVLLPVIGEGQLHKGGGVQPGVFGAEHVRTPVPAAGLPEQGEGDGIEDRGLSRPGVPGDEV